MDQQLWGKVNKIVDTALDLKEKERTTYIEEQCGGNSDLKQQVTELLESIEKSATEDFLEGTEAYPKNLAVDFSEENLTAGSTMIGETIGNYKILELIGHGGMGSVFLTERVDGAYDKKVALKLLRRGMDTPSNIARFRQERNILANLDHPNIARLLDGGVTGDGLPYLVMEYVGGVTLLKYCNNHQLSIEQRIELFTSVCKAVQHAHRNATIHRDLKPSNIKVTEDGTVKVLDFGIAKMLESDTADFFQTRTGARILTFGYAAPEQFENQAVTTATDSYTLGIVLYELLAGVHPFDMEKKNLSKIENLVRNHTPIKPSEKFSALSGTKKSGIALKRSNTVSEITQKLKGDLDAIVMKALRKEPEARYSSVEQMLEDINRYKQSLPLIAQSDTLQYRFGKFIRRNRKAVVGGFLILIAIVGFGSFHINRITEERNIAETEAQKAQTIKNFLIDIFRSSNPQSTSFEGKDMTAEQLLLTGESKINNELNDQPDVYTEIMLAIGDALFGIDAFNEAKKSYEKALAKTPETAESLENKARAYVKLSKLNTDWRSNQEKAYQHARSAQKNLEKIENPPPTLEASVYGLLGRTISVRDNYEEGNAYFEKADSVYVNAGLENSYEYIQMLTEYGRSLIYVFDFKKSEATLQKSNELHRQKYANPTLTIAENYKFMAWANRELGNFEKSNNYFLKSIDLKKELTGGQTVKTAISMYHLARNYTLMGNFEKSEKIAQQVLNIYQKHLDASNQYIHQAKNYLAIAKYNQNKFDEAEQLMSEVLETRRTIDTDNKMFLAGVAAQLAVVYRKTGQFQEAISLLEESIQINEKNLGADSRGVAVDMIKLGAVYRDMRNYEQAQQYFLQAESILKEETPKNHYRRAELYFKFAKLKQNMGQSQVAREYFNQAYNLYINNFGVDSNRAKQAKSFLDQIAKA